MRALTYPCCANKNGSDYCHSTRPSSSHSIDYPLGFLPVFSLYSFHVRSLNG